MNTIKCGQCDQQAYFVAVVIQLLSLVWLFAIPWILDFSTPGYPVLHCLWNLLKCMFIESMMLFNRFIFYCPQSFPASGSFPMKKKCQKAKWLSEEALQIAEKRREAKGKGDKERYTHVNTELQQAYSAINMDQRATMCNSL